MKFIAHYLNLIGLLLLMAFSATAAGLYFNVPERIKAARVRTDKVPASYACPMHPNVTSATQANCTECGMKLVALTAEKTTRLEAKQDGCCAIKIPVAEPPPTAACPYLAAQAARSPSCCSKPANH